MSKLLIAWRGARAARCGSVRVAAMTASPICYHFQKREEENGDFRDKVTIRSILAAKLGRAENLDPKLLAPRLRGYRC